MQKYFNALHFYRLNFNMVVYLNCESIQFKTFHVFIIKNSIIHIHPSNFTSKRFILFKNTTYNIRLAIFRSILFRFTNLLPQKKKMVHPFSAD